MDKKKIMKAIVFIAVLLIPIMYSFFYLKAYWDPYGNLEDIKVAIVNLDEGENGENQGTKLVDSLKEKDVVNICDTTEEDANNGLVNRDYYAVITIPSDFTHTLNNAENSDRVKATIKYAPNQKTNYLASQIINKIVASTETALQGQISKGVVEKLSDNLRDVPESLEEISSGADEILNGTKSLTDGLSTMKDGTETLSNSYNQFDDGLKAVSAGASTLDNGLSNLKTGVDQVESGSSDLSEALSLLNNGASTLEKSGAEGIQKLTAGIDSLSTGSTSLNSGVTQYVAGVNAYNEKTTSLMKAIVAYGDANPAVLQDENIAQIYGMSKLILASNTSDKLATNGEALVQGSSNLKAGVDTFKNSSSSLSKLGEGITTLKTSISQIQAGANKLQTGTQQLSDGTNQLKTGSQSLKNGTKTLENNSTKIKEALTSLQTGTQTAYDGSKELNQGVQTFKDEVENGLTEAKEEIKKLDGLNDYIEDPVEIVEEDYGEISSYGVSFTPLFLSIGLWVGGLMAFVVLYYDQEKRFKLLGKYADNKLLRILLYVGIGVAQGLITGFLLKLGLGFDVTSNCLYYSSCVLVSVVFISIIQLLIVNFGDIGKFIGLLILVLQLAASGGTFPVETVSKGFQVISPYLPMTYTIRLLKESIILEDAGFVGQNVAILAGIAVVCLALTVVCDVIRTKKKVSE